MPPETLLSMDCVTVLLVWVLEASNPSVVTEPIPALEVTSPFSVTLESGSPVICPGCRDGALQGHIVTKLYGYFIGILERGKWSCVLL